MNYQQPGALPFPIDKPLWNAPYVVLGSPTFLPPVNTIPQLGQYVPVAASIAQLEIIGKAANNALRMFMYNQYSRDNFQNPEFVELVQMAIDYTHVRLMGGGTFATELDAISQITPFMVTLLCCGNIKVFPQLAQYVDQATFAEANGMLNQLTTISRQIDQLRQPQGQMMTPQYGARPGPQAYSQGYGGGMPAGMPMQRATLAGVSTGLIAPTGSRGEQAMGLSAPREAYGTNRYANQLQAQQPQAPVMMAPVMAQVPLQQPFVARQPAQLTPTVNAAGEVMISSDGVNAAPGNPRYSSSPGQDEVNRTASLRRYPATAAVQDASGQAVPAPVSTAQPLVEESQVKWKRSDIQPYLPLVDPRTSKLMFKQLPGGVWYGEAVEKTKEEIMEFDKHVIRASQGSDLNNPQVTEEKPVVHLPDPKTLPLSVSEDSIWKILPTLEGAVMDFAVEVCVNGETLGAGEILRRFIYTVEPIAVESIDLQVSIESILNQIYNCTKFADAKDILDSMNNEVHCRAMNRLDALLTAELLKVFYVNLGLSRDVSIDSFREDIMEVMKVFRGSATTAPFFGETVYRALESMQGNIIRSAVNCMPEEWDQRDSAVTQLESVGADENFRGSVVFIAQCHSVTLTGQTSEQLGLTGVTRVPRLITIAQAPFLHKVVEDHFASQQVLEHNFATHVITTSDGKRYEVRQGFLNKDGYMVNMYE
jgi:hypothetical protein